MMAAGPLIGAGVEAYTAHKQGKSAGAVAAAARIGAAKGAVDAIVPGARTGYADVIGDKQLTLADRILNGLDHVTAQTTAAGGIAMGGEALGVVTLPAEIPTAIVTGVAFIGNAGVNLVKAGVKVTGYAGKDQDGGYIYDSAVLAGHAAKAAAEKIGHLFSGPQTVAPHATPAQPVSPPHPESGKNAVIASR
jgi:hypothetical protein